MAFWGDQYGISQSQVSDYISGQAPNYGVPTSTALGIFGAEGGGSQYIGDIGNKAGPSYGPYQLNTSGLGATATTQGINIQDPTTWQSQVDFSLAQMGQSGVQPWTDTYVAQQGAGNLNEGLGNFGVNPGTAQNPLPGLTAADYGGGSSPMVDTSTVAPGDSNPALLGGDTSLSQYTDPNLPAIGGGLLASGGTASVLGNALSFANNATLALQPSAVGSAAIAQVENWIGQGATRIGLLVLGFIFIAAGLFYFKSGGSVSVAGLKSVHGKIIPI